MNDFSGMEEALREFLLEVDDMISDVDDKLMKLEKSPSDGALLNEIFLSFHSLMGSAQSVYADEIVLLSTLAESLFDKLRKKELKLNEALMNLIFAATAEVRNMVATLQQNRQLQSPPAEIINALKAAIDGRTDEIILGNTTIQSDHDEPATLPAIEAENIDWEKIHKALTAVDIVEQVGAKRDPEAVKRAISEEESTRKAFGRRSTDVPGETVGRRDGDVSVGEGKETTIRVDTERLDQVLNLSGEIGLTKNRLTHLRSDILQGRSDSDTLRELDLSVTQLDMLVVNLQNAVMKTRMQPIGRLFKKYPRLARDLARSLGKDVELVLIGEETEMDKTMIEDLNDPLVHLVRNAVDHGVETIEERRAAGKPEKSMVELSARQEGDHILITITDDGKGMRPEVIRNKAVEKGLITNEVANTLDENQCLELVFLPGFSTKDEISSVSGRGVGMDVVKTNIQKLSGSIQIQSEVGKGSTFSISLPLTLAILPVLVLRLGDQSFAVPLSMVREILPVTPDALQQVSGKATMIVRGEVLPVLPLTQLIGWGNNERSEVGVLMQFGSNSFILTADGFVGHEDVVIKSLDTFRPKGVAGVTMSSEGDIVLILDIKELLSDVRGN